MMQKLSPILLPYFNNIQYYDIVSYHYTILYFHKLQLASSQN